MSTPIFDRLSEELGFVQHSTNPAVRYRESVGQGWTLASVQELRDEIRLYSFKQVGGGFPSGVRKPYHVNHENHSLQKVTIEPLSDMVERCLPSKETCMTLDEIPGGQEHGVVIPPEPERTHHQRILELLQRNPEWVQRYTGTFTRIEAQHNDGRGVLIEFHDDGSFDRAMYFDLGELTKVVEGYEDLFDNLTTAISARAYWPEHVRRVEAEAEDAPQHPVDPWAEEIAEAERMAANAETRRLDDLANEEADRQSAISQALEGQGLVIQAKRWLPGDPNPGSLHEASDGKYLNPGATIARHRAIEETELARTEAPVYGTDITRSGGAIFAQFPDGSIRMVQDRSTLASPTGGPAVGADAKQFPKRFELPPEVVEKVEAKVAQIKKMAEDLTGARTKAAEDLSAMKDELQPTSILPQGHEFELLREAADTIGGGRQDDYGNAEDSFTAIAKMWQAYLAARGGRGPLDGRDVACMMSLLKVARDAKGRKRDNLVDLAGYAALAERATRSKR